MDLKCDDEHTDYLMEWIAELKQQKRPYQEPLLSPTTLNFLKYACEKIGQDNHVFIMACDVLENFVRCKLEDNAIIPHKVHFLLSVLSLLSKHIGEYSDVVRNLQVLYYNVMKTTISSEQLKKGEIDIMKTLRFKLPLFSIIDDLKLIIKLYIEPIHIRINFLSLCEDIMCCVYIYRKDLFTKVKTFYEISKEGLEMFKEYVENPFYLCVGIIITTIRVTLLKNFFDVDKVVQTFSKECKINFHHIYHLSDHIINLIKFE